MVFVTPFQWLGTYICVPRLQPSFRNYFSHVPCQLKHNDEIKFNKQWKILYEKTKILINLQINPKLFIQKVATTEGETEASRWGCNFMETSAKTNHNVKELFQELLNMEKNRNISLQLDSKKSSRQKLPGSNKIKEKCSVMWINSSTCNMCYFVSSLLMKRIGIN